MVFRIKIAQCLKIGGYVGTCVGGPPPNILKVSKPKHPVVAPQELAPMLTLMLSAPKSQRFLRFAIAMPIAHPRSIARFPRQEHAMLHCDLRVRWKVASDLRFRAAISGPKTPPFCGISGDLAHSTRKSLAIAIVRFWCAELS